MRKAVTAACFGIIAFFLLAGRADAKWWIFGGSSDQVRINYLYLNNMSFEEGGQKVTIFKDTLQDGMLYIKGKASTGKGNIGSVRITKDNKETWEEAKLSEGGAFEYGFKPEAGKTYVIYVEAMDTAGKTNDVEATFKQVTVSEQSYMQAVREALDNMVAAYESEDPAKFMAYVSNAFTGDSTLLDRAIRQDFSAFDNIDITFTLNNISSDAKGRIYVSINYNRKVISTRSGQMLTDKGTTEFIFSLEEGGPKIYSMKNPLIFGLSDATNVAQGTVTSSSNDPILVVYSDGQAATLDFRDAINVINNGGQRGASAESGTVILTQRGIAPVDFDTLTVSTGEKQAEAGLNPAVGDVGPKCALPHPLLLFKAGVKWKDMGSGPISSVTSVPDQSTYSSSNHTTIVEDEIFALYLSNGKYGLIRITSSTFADGVACSVPSSITVEYKYQPDGTGNF